MRCTWSSLPLQYTHTLIIPYGNAFFVLYGFSYRRTLFLLPSNLVEFKLCFTFAKFFCSFYGRRMTKSRRFLCWCFYSVAIRKRLSCNLTSCQILFFLTFSSFVILKSKRNSLELFSHSKCDFVYGMISIFISFLTLTNS